MAVPRFDNMTKGALWYVCNCPGSPDRLSLRSFYKNSITQYLDGINWFRIHPYVAKQPISRLQWRCDQSTVPKSKY